MSTTLDNKPHVHTYHASRGGVSTMDKKNVQGKNTHTEEDNNDNGAEQPLTIEVRLERRPEKTCYKKTPWAKKKQEIWVGTMAHAPAIGSLSYGGFTKVRVSIVQ